MKARVQLEPKTQASKARPKSQRSPVQSEPGHAKSKEPKQGVQERVTSCSPTRVGGGQLSFLRIRTKQTATVIVCYSYSPFLVGDEPEV